MAGLSINEMTTLRWSFEEDVRHFAEAEVRAIGVWREKLSDYGEDRGVELLAEHRMAVSSLLWAGGFTGSDGRSHAESIADGQEAIRLAAALRADCLVVHSGARGLHTQSHARRLLRDALDALLPTAIDLGVVLALEPMHPGGDSGWTFLTSFDDALELVAAYASPFVKLVFDSYAWGHDLHLIAQLPAFVDRLALVQLGDRRAEPQLESNRCPLGEGILPLGELVGQLRRAGYSGHFELELLGEEMELADYQELIRQSKREFEQWCSAPLAAPHFASTPVFASPEQLP